MSDIIKADVVIMGAGATGLAAAVQAAQSGAKVICFEKEKNFGGTGNFFEGTFAVGSHFQREIFETYTTDQAFKFIMEYSHWLANPRLVRNIVEESASTIDWLEDAGVEFYGARINLPESPRTYHVAKGLGAAVMAALYKTAKELGVDFRFETPVTEIFKEGGRISGVLAEDGSGEEVEVEAPAVIIASGGYLNNKEWVKKYTGYTIGEDLLVVGNVDKMGDGIRMAWELGAAEEGTGVLEMFSVGPDSPNSSSKNDLEAISMQPDLWVDKFGRRFCDEAVTFYDTTVGNASAKCPGGFSWRVFDTSVIERIKTTGIDKNLGQAKPPGTPIPTIEDDLNSNLENNPNEVVGADSIEELAAKMDIDPAVFRKTVDEYNEACSIGHDAIFAKDREWLRPITGPKYYALKGHTTCLGTKGGIKINENMEVVDKKYQVIPGLYAGGFDAGGLYGDSYTISGSSGLSSGYALNSGKIAGRNATVYAKEAAK
ncbi:MAG: FAD-dependent oxidoreductase [Clostridiales Family XIII bacterium]|jgi:fumarate reductase flavoprotein subunit|nr:FAD-dependent oxidoreductase [Clostridiales Family XIII bacterium]